MREESSSSAHLPRPTPIQAAWQDLELGLFVHFNMFTYSGSWNWRSFRDYPSPDLFRPDRLDTDQWMEAARAFGAKYAVLTAKHCCGFCLWPTEAYDYGVRQSAWRGGKGDVVADFVTSCRKYGILPGLYYSTAANGYLKVDNPGLIAAPGGPVDQAGYTGVCEQQLRELWSRYGELGEIWFDGSAIAVEKGGPDIGALLRKLQPRASIFQSPHATIRWIGNEDGVAPDPCWATVSDAAAVKDGVSASLGSGDPDGAIWLPGECDVPIRKGQWGWQPNEDHLVSSLDHLMSLYDRSVGRNCNLLLNSNPDRDGLIPATDMQRYKEFGAEIRRQFGRSVAETSGQGSALELVLKQPTRIDRVAIMEEITRGARVRDYVVEAFAGGRWNEICRGTSIGHKKIDRFPAVEVVKLRLNVRRAVSEPLIRAFAAYGA
jgi:alpha-L-fucosidase